MIKILFKILRYVCDFLGFFAILFCILVITAKLTRTPESMKMPRSIDVFVQTTGDVVKACFDSKNITYAESPSAIAKLWTHIKLLTKNIFYSENFEHGYTEKIFGLNISFQNYLAMHQLANEIFIQNAYAFKSDNLKPFIIDAGSNIGISILFFKKLYPEASILGFEPSLKNAYFLEKNIKNNNLNQIKIINKALSDVDNQEVKLYSPGTISGTLQQFGRNHIFETVQTTQLSHYITQKVDLLKIDIEGAEYSVFKDLFNSGKLNFVQKIIMEYHEPQSNIAGLFEILDKVGFTYEIINRYIYAQKKL